MERVSDPTIHAGELVIIDGPLYGEALEETRYEEDPAQCGDLRYL